VRGEGNHAELGEVGLLDGTFVGILPSFSNLGRVDLQGERDRP
jgi:hypothetical protein